MQSEENDPVPQLTINFAPNSKRNDDFGSFAGAKTDF